MSQAPCDQQIGALLGAEGGQAPGGGRRCPDTAHGTPAVGRSGPAVWLHPTKGSRRFPGAGRPLVLLAQGPVSGLQNPQLFLVRCWADERDWASCALCLFPDLSPYAARAPGSVGAVCPPQKPRGLTRLMLDIQRERWGRSARNGQGAAISPSTRPSLYFTS